MKRITLFLLMLATVSAFAQKAPKPNLAKALTSWKEGKLDEAKANIDLAPTYEKTMNDPKTYYYKGLIYGSIDTTSNEAYKALDPNAFTVALESFKKADELSKGKELFIQDATGMPVTKTIQMTNWANGYINKGADLYQEEDLENALKAFEKAQAINPQDTLASFYGGYSALGIEDYDKALSSFQKYIDNGGKNAEAYIQIVAINSGPKQNKEEALRQVRLAKAKYPNNTELPKHEIGLLIDLKKIDEAKAGLEAAIKKEPNNKLLYFFLGYANQNLNDLPAAKKNYEDALKLDPKYFDAQIYLAKLMYTDVVNSKKEMANLGISAADKKKKFEIDKVLVEHLQTALPYWEKAEKLNPDDQEVLDTLFSIYQDLGNEEGMKRIQKRFKELGIEN